MNRNVGALALFGTDEPVAERRALRAGPLGAILEDGNLRTIRYAGVEVIRAINYLARDASWGTLKPELSDLRIAENETGFIVRYKGLCKGPQGGYAYAMKITGDAGGLTMEAEGAALSGFLTNRTGFVVLHPSEAAGAQLTITHSDGRIEDTAFPKIICPDQPAFDISALTHEPMPGLVCTVTMEGDAFEMEDQRNWTDASFKTYIRPLSKPRPYLIGEGEKNRQSIVLSIEAASLAAQPKAVAAATLTLGKPAGRMPGMALFIAPDDLSKARAHASSLGRAQNLIVRFDAARGDGAATFAQASDLAAAIGAGLAIEAVFDAVDPQAEAERVADAVEASGVQPGAILVCPRREFRTRPSKTLPSAERPVADIVAALRKAGIGAAIGAGTPSYFTEFNRNPPVGEADFVFFGNAAIVHAADDLSVMETLSVYPSTIATAKYLCPGKPVWLGPCTLAMRHNPYGSDVAANAANARVPGAGRDPRHGALFGAAFAVGIAAQAIASGIDRLILASPTGPFGLLDDDGNRHPLQAVHAELASAAGAEFYDVTIDRPGIAAVAYDAGERIRILVANLTGEDVEILIPPGLQRAGMIGQAEEPGASRQARINLGRYRTMMLRTAPLAN